MEGGQAVSNTNNMSNATLIKWNDAKPNAEFLRIRSDGSFEIQGGAPTLFVLGELVHAFLKQQDRIKRLEEAGDGLLTAMRDDWSEYVDWIDETTDAIGKWNEAKEAKP
jgi:hypothetical protein